MLTKEILAANAALSGLTDEQAAAVIELAESDKADDIGKKFGEVYRQLDATIEATTGVKRNGDEKTYKYLERAAKTVTEAAAQEKAALTAEVERLTAVIADGAGDKETKDALAAAQRELAAVQGKYTELQHKYDKSEKAHAAELFGVHVDNAIANATAAVKFKPELSAGVTGVILKDVVSKVKGMNPEFVDNGKGGKVLVFKNEAGEILRNEASGLQPYSAGELITEELRKLGVLDEGRQMTGTGTHAPAASHGAGSTVDVSGAKTQVEAREIIHNVLTARGLVNGSKEYTEAMKQAYAAADVLKLPLK